MAEKILKNNLLAEYNILKFYDSASGRIQQKKNVLFGQWPNAIKKNLQINHTDTECS